MIVLSAALSACTAGPESADATTSTNMYLSSFEAGNARKDGNSLRYTLFRVTKDENKNYVVYDVVADAQGKLASEPIDAYWVMAEKNGQRAQLNFAERGAYGVAVKDVDRDAGELTFVIKGFDSKPMRVDKSPDGQRVMAYTTIAGEPAAVDTIHLKIKKTLNPLSPDVRAELTGVSTKTGKPVQEEIRN